MSNLSEVDILILCGGRGTRMANVTNGLPKIMIEINGKPFLEYLLNYLEISGFRRVILCTGYKNRYIEDWINNGFNRGLEIVISTEQTPLGTGGAVKNAEGKIDSEHFFVMNGDSLIFDSFVDILNYHLQNKNDCTIVVKKASNTKRFGSIGLSKDKRIMSFSEKEESDGVYFNAGIYIFKNKIIDIIESNKNISLEYETFPTILKREDFRIYGYVSDEDYIDIGTVESFKQTSDYLIRNRALRG